jgi:hypothetical protein
MADNLVRRSHSIFQRDLGQDRLKLPFGIRECIEPLPVERCHDLCRNNCVHADAVTEQLRRPFAGQS